jgi:outer membrane biosynthesis protein TonB
VLFHRQPVAPEVNPATPPTKGTEAPGPALTPFHERPDEVASISELDAAPRPVRTVMPRLGGRREYSGQQVNVSVLIDEKGIPREPSVAEIEDERLARLCCEAVTRWRFAPATKAGRPVKVRVTVPFAVR